MADYYQILGLSQTATAAQIRAAFKRLAMQYHPDRNPNNPMAEELFKQVNEAYHILSDPLKKARYDSRFYANETQSYTEAAEYAREMRRRQQQTRSRPNPKPQEKTYSITGNYFKVQGLAFLVFLIMSGISFGIVNLASYFFDLKHERERKEYRARVNEVNALFGAGKIGEAITRIDSLQEASPLNFYFITAHDSLITQIGRMADQEFESRNFERALYYYQHFKKYQERGHTETLQKISICQYRVGRYADAVQTLKQLLSEQPWSLELIYQIAILNLDQLNNIEEAMFYFNLGEKTFRENMTQIYGEAYMIAINPATIPDIYYEIFIAKAQTEISLKEYAEADGDLELALYLRPARPEGYYHRATLNIARNKRSTVCADLAKAKNLGAENTIELQRKHCR